MRQPRGRRENPMGEVSRSPESTVVERTGRFGIRARSLGPRDSCSSRPADTAEPCHKGSPFRDHPRPRVQRGPPHAGWNSPTRDLAPLTQLSSPPPCTNGADVRGHPVSVREHRVSSRSGARSRPGGTSGPPARGFARPGSRRARARPRPFRGPSAAPEDQACPSSQPAEKRWAGVYRPASPGSRTHEPITCEVGKNPDNRDTCGKVLWNAHRQLPACLDEIDLSGPRPRQAR